jgi:iron(III) transport system ATP-binding protein
MIAGLEAPDQGSIEFDGRDITSLTPERRGFGMVFQNYALFPHLDVYENVAFGLRARHRPKAEVAERVAGALTLVQLPGYQRRRVEELSGGQQQRVAIARAIAIEPALLLFDEPLSNLDVALREETRGELRELVARLGLTAVYVTHDQEEAFALCDRINVMDAGRILQTGTPREIYERPAQLAVARFLGRNNLLRVMRLSQKHESLATFKTLEGGHTLTARAEPDTLPPINKPCTLAIRPEHINITRSSSATDRWAHDAGKAAHASDATFENVFQARVREINFAGATTTVKLEANGLRLEALLLSPDGLKAGDTCTISIPAARINVLEGEDQG